MYKKLLCLLCAFGFLANGYATEPTQVEIPEKDVVSNDTPSDDVATNVETDVNTESDN